MEFKITYWGEEFSLKFYRMKYRNGNTYIGVLDTEANEPFCDLTVNFEDTMVEDRAYLDINNCPREIIDYLFDNKLGVILDYERSGFCTYPLVKFSEKFMKEVATC